MAGELEQRPIVDDVAGLRILAAEHGAHAVVEDVFRHTAQCLERGGLAAQQRRQVLVQHEAGPQHAAVARAPARTAKGSAPCRARQ